MVGYDKLLAELQRRRAHAPQHAETFALYCELLTAQARTPVSPREYASIAQIAPARIERGLAVLPAEAFRAEGDALAQLCDEICFITACQRADLRDAVENIGAWLAHERAALLTHAIEYLQGREFSHTASTGLDLPLLAFVFNHALHPFLRAYALVLAPFVDTTIWYRAHCPVCGGEPDFAALAPESGARTLLCARCDFEWVFWRGTCPFCECDDPDQQKYFLSADEVYRLYTCEKCGRYIKTIDLRQVADERLLPVERIITLPLDLAARQMLGDDAPPDV